MASYLHFDLLVVLGVIVTVVYLYYKRRKLAPLPPGPRGWPIIGNLFQLPQSNPWETYGTWSKKYGDVVYVNEFGKPNIIINSFKAAFELLERRSNIYSSRPQYVMFHDLMDFGGTTAFQPYGDTWRKHRTLYNQQLHSGAIGQFKSLQVNAVNHLLRILLDSPENHIGHLRHMAANIVVNFAYGYEIKPKDDPLVKFLQSNTLSFIKAIRPGAYLVDSIPFLKYIPVWLPGAGFKKEAKEARSRVQQTRDVPFRDVKNQLKAGKARPSFVANSLSDLGIDDESNEDVDAVKRVAGGILGAGMDTTASTLNCFILAMALYPDVRKKAQAELDGVVGKGRLPEFSDRPALPYMSAIVKETLRWFPVVPTALPHATIAEDVYESYRIPAGSTVIANTWSILHDPEIYADPTVFRPERFLPGKNGKLEERDPFTTGCFGFGRRICAGKNLADATLWLTMASLLSAFDISNAVNANGSKIDPRHALQPAGGSICRPKPFSCTITPRSKEIETLIKSL